MTITAGYDVGGAHLKIALVEHARVVDVQQIPCPLWRGLNELETALGVAEPLIRLAHRHAVTMTAELTEIFDTREKGVVTILDQMNTHLNGNVSVFMGLKGFATTERAATDPMSAASANFLATCRLIAARRPKALLIDMGSTTTDIIPCDRPQGLTDAERLQTGELVYSGFTRTPIPSVTTRAPLAGQWQSLAGDAFATMADVRRILGEMSDDADQHGTTDGRGKSVAESLGRLARGFGRDADMRQLTTWQSAARYISERQLRAVHDGALQVLSRPGLEVTSAVVAGVGASAAESIAIRLGLPRVSFGSLIDAPEACRLRTTRCAPAVAVALLADAA